MTNKEQRVSDRCRVICKAVDETTAVTMIKEEFKGCAVRAKMRYGKQGVKDFMGMIMWEDINISF